MATEEEARKTPAVERTYANPMIEVGWEPARCIHIANCIRALPHVFDPQARPWVAIDAAAADEIARAIETCPTGALTYRRLDGEPGEQPRTPTEVNVRPNGPLLLSGDISVTVAATGESRAVTRAALCRCGASANKPFCDLTHRAIGFKG